MTTDRLYLDDRVSLFLSGVLPQTPVMLSRWLSDCFPVWADTPPYDRPAERKGCQPERRGG